MADGKTRLLVLVLLWYWLQNKTIYVPNPIPSHLLAVQHATEKMIKKGLNADWVANLGSDSGDWGQSRLLGRGESQTQEEIQL